METFFDFSNTKHVVVIASVKSVMIDADLDWPIGKPALENPVRHECTNRGPGITRRGA
jgi:hypothetical protein